MAHQKWNIAPNLVTISIIIMTIVFEIHHVWGQWQQDSRNIIHFISFDEVKCDVPVRKKYSSTT